MGATQLTVEIGGIAVRLESDDAAFVRIVESRYRCFLNDKARPSSVLRISVVPGTPSDEDLQIGFDGGRWRFHRGDFSASWDPKSGDGHAELVASPYAVDSMLRVLHTIILAREGGFLVHAASAIVDGKAYLFAGKSGAGKTTISRLAPPSATLLSDEISYVRRSGDGYIAYGTPFSGELAKAGENVCAPLTTVFLLEQGPENKIKEVSSAEGLRNMLKNILFFAEDPVEVQHVFEAASEFASRVNIRRMVFAPNPGIWELVA